MARRMTAELGIYLDARGRVQTRWIQINRMYSGIFTSNSSGMGFLIYTAVLTSRADIALDFANLYHINQK